jgi:hypothetical protein
VRKPTLIVIVILFGVIAIAGIAQIVLASGDKAPLPGPTSPGQLPSLAVSPSP